MAEASPSVPTGLSIQILDVGQGDGIYIEFPNGKNMLVDFGTTKPTKAWKVAPPDALKYLRENTRFARQGQTLDYLVVTHADSDHYNLIPKFVAEFKPVIRYLLIAGSQEDYKGDFKKWFDQVVLDNASTPVANGSPVMLRAPKRLPFPMWETDQLRQEMEGTGRVTPTEANLRAFGGVAVVVLAMNTEAVQKTSDHGWVSNTRSIVLWMSYAGRTLCLAGDATRDTEDAVMLAMKKLGPDHLSTNLLKVGHHGSARTSNQPAWIKWLSPAIAIVSSDRHGALDEAVAKQYRLPQELCIDLIRNNTKLAAAVEHGYVSSYDPKDYAEYQVPGASDKGYPLDPSKKSGLVAPMGDEEDDTSPRRQWYQATTTEALFSTLALMDFKSPDDASEADQGVQYGIYVSPQGVLRVYSTLEPNKLLARIP